MCNYFNLFLVAHCSSTHTQQRKTWTLVLLIPYQNLPFPSMHPWWREVYIPTWPWIYPPAVYHSHGTWTICRWFTDLPHDLPSPIGFPQPWNPIWLCRLLPEDHFTNSGPTLKGKLVMNTERAFAAWPEKNRRHSDMVKSCEKVGNWWQFFAQSCGWSSSFGVLPVLPYLFDSELNHQWYFMTVDNTHPYTMLLGKSSMGDFPLP